MKTCNISELLGKTLALCGVNSADDEISFITTTGKAYRMYHDQDCCESVTIDDINGDLQDLIGSPITLAKESSNRDYPPRKDGSCGSWTWTFYRLATVKGYVNIKWFGTSNGYYSESVNFKEVI